MARNVNLRELLVGVEGLALLRHRYEGTDEDAAKRLTEVRRILADDAFADREVTSEADPRTGYGAWSQDYDEPGNPIIEIEQPTVWSLLDTVPPGSALDAACGTGRHARRLVELGHEVVGIDLTPEMLEVAAAKVPGASFLEADLRHVPAEDEHFDLVVCGLALSHLGDPRRTVAELARVLKPGGRVAISVLHPFLAYLGWHAPFANAQGERHFVREHPHSHADYLAAFRSAGLYVRGCAEPRLTADQVPAKRRAFRHVPEATMAAYAGLPAVLVWDTEKVRRS
jgi:SAM-dependent methyltransferase